MNRKLKSFLFEFVAWLGAPLVVVVLYGLLTVNFIEPEVHSVSMNNESNPQGIDLSHISVDRESVRTEKS